MFSSCIPIRSRCEVIGEEISTPVCVTITEQEVEEFCEDKPVDVKCFEKDCKPSTRTTLEKVCNPKTEQVCETVLDEMKEEKCKTIVQSKIEEVCRMETEEKCTTEFEYVCQNTSPAPKQPAEPIATLSTEYGVPLADPVSRSDDLRISRSDPTISTVTARSTTKSTETTQRVRLSTTEATSTSKTRGLSRVRHRVRFGSRVKRDWPQHPGLDPPFGSTASSFPNFPVDYTASLGTTYFPQEVPTQSYGNAEQEQPAVQCEYKPRKNCTQIPRQFCDQVAKEIPEEICLTVPKQVARKVCNPVTRNNCDVVSKVEKTEKCDLVPSKVPTQRVCNFRPRPVDREVCQDVQMQAFREECQQIPKTVPKVECKSTMKPIELKEICINVDLQLPREECSTSVKQDCR